MKKQFTIAILSITTTFFSSQLKAQETIHGEIFSEEGFVVAKYEYNNPTCFNSEDGNISIQLLDGVQSLIWNDASTIPYKKNLSAGEYNFKLQLNEDILDYTLTLESPEEIIGTIHQTTNLNSINLNLEVVGGVAPYMYLWNNGSTSTNLENITTSGFFQVSILDQNKCKASSNIYINKVLIPSSYNNDQNLKMGLDDSNKILTIKGGEIENVIVLHETGNSIPQIRHFNENGEFLFQLEQKGMYVISIYNNEGVKQRKIMI